MIVPSVIVLVIMGLGISGQPTNIKTMRDAELYLYKFGHLTPSVNNLEYRSLRYSDKWTDAIKSFQQTGGLSVTGYLDDDTLKLMNKPRCGIKDKGSSGNHYVGYTLLGGSFNVKDLTYKISKYPQRLSEADTDREVSRAFALWSEYTDLTFTQMNSGHVNIDISFVQGDHGDGHPFDGPGEILGHANPPYYGKSKAHFDDSEYWTIDANDGINLFMVAAHEFGHSLGIDHSEVGQSLMYPFYIGYIPNFHLYTDDISAIQALYGKKTYTKSRPRKPSTPKPVSDYDQEYSYIEVSPTARPNRPPSKPSRTEPVPGYGQDYGQVYSRQPSSDQGHGAPDHNNEYPKYPIIPQHGPYITYVHNSG